jgi:putative CocE/NonD family hydrolase
MGENVWRDESEWPLARTRYTPYYLHSQGRANSLQGDGQLSAIAPAEEPPDRYVYNPNDPVPTGGGNTLIIPMGVQDQRPIEARPDVLVYTSKPLAEPVEVTGPITVELYAASSAPDTDFTAKLVDVRPDGYAQNLADGIIRARYRVSRSIATLLTPGEVTRFSIDLWATSHVFFAGHRLRVEIASSNFPRFDRNLNTGADQATSTHMQSAEQTVFHDARYPSHIRLPIIPR